MIVDFITIALVNRSGLLFINLAYLKIYKRGSVNIFSSGNTPLQLDKGLTPQPARKHLFVRQTLPIVALLFQTIISLRRIDAM